MKSAKHVVETNLLEQMTINKEAIRKSIAAGIIPQTIGYSKETLDIADKIYFEYITDPDDFTFDKITFNVDPSSEETLLTLYKSAKNKGVYDNVKLNQIVEAVQNLQIVSNVHLLKEYIDERNTEKKEKKNS